MRRTACRRCTPTGGASQYISGGSIELLEYFADDLRGLVSGKWFAALGGGNFCRKVFDRMHSADQNVSEGLRARLRIVERLHRRGDGMVRGGGDRVNECHRLLSAVCRRNSRLAVRILLMVPLRERLVIPALTRMEKPSRRLGRRLIDVGSGAGLGIAAGVIGRMLPFRFHWHEKSAVGVSYDVHRSTPKAGRMVITTLPNSDRANHQRIRAGIMALETRGPGGRPDRM